MEKFRGKFQFACNVNRGRSAYLKFFEEYDYAWDWYRHCSCDMCELQRQEINETQCIDKSCEGCKNMASGKKVRSWVEDSMKGRG